MRDPKGLPTLHGDLRIRILPGTRLHAIYAMETIEAGHFCNYGVNPDYVPRFEAAGLRISGLGSDDEVRAVELPDHRFYVATLFHPALESRPEKPSPLVMAFLDAAAGG